MNKTDTHCTRKTRHLLAVVENFVVLSYIKIPPAVTIFLFELDFGRVHEVRLIFVNSLRSKHAMYV